MNWVETLFYISQLAWCLKFVKCSFLNFEWNVNFTMITCNIDGNMGNRNLQTWSYTWFCKVLNECKLHMFLKIKSLFQLFQESFGPILEQIRNFPTSASSESMLPQSNPKNWIKTPTNSSKVRFEVSIKILRVRHSACSLC